MKKILKLLLLFSTFAILNCSGAVEDNIFETSLGESWFYKSNNVKVTATMSFSSVSALESVYLAVGDDGKLYSGSALKAMDMFHVRSGESIQFKDIVTGLSSAVAVGGTGGLGSNYSIAVLSRSITGLVVQVAAQGGVSSTLNGVAYGGGLYVAVGDSGNIQFSANPSSSWAQATAAGGFVGQFTAVSYLEGAGLFVAVGESGEIQTSPDGMSWTQQSAAAGFVGDFFDIAAGNSAVSGMMAVAVGASGEMQYSADGITWTQGNALLLGAGGYTCVAFAGGVFLVAGGAGTSNQVEITQSPDVSWLTLTPKSGVTYGGCNGFPYVNSDRFVLLRPSSGTFEWSDASCVFRTVNFTDEQVDDFTSIAMGTNVAVAVGPNIISTFSLNDADISSTKWVGSQQDAGGSGADLYSVIWDGTQFIAAGDAQQIETSSDGTTWTEVNSGGVGDFKDIAFGLSMYVTVGNTAGIWTSPDLTTWTGQTAGGGSTNNLNSVAYGQLMFVAVGDSGEIQTSTDGSTWTQQTPDGGYVGNFQSVVYASNRNEYIAVGSGGEIQTSLDGVTWARQTPDNSFSGVFYSVAYTNGVFIAVGESGEIQISSNGEMWSSQNSGYDFVGDFFAVGASAKVGISVGERGLTEVSFP